ncbi:Transposase InsO and inactivated derivatives [Paraburkholderia steynii]|uniref:Transposase InsO and inactivated derivatives n=1 Tax=Paraburkholderia steynii TaxID=1245441 RepID=A0A7Z7BBA6_9BURK|nr:Transposase InsO and inactivated derivatives [Paraburkholderia steynii]
MTSKAKRAQYTLEFKLEAVRLVEAGQSMATVAATLSVVEQTLYNWVRNRHHWPVSVLCEALEVSPSGYHQRRQRTAQAKPHRGRVSDDALLAHIKTIHTQVRGEYGWPRMWKELLTHGVRVGKERVRKLMAQHGIRARHKRKYIATTNSNHDLPVAPNLLERNFTATAPNHVWTTGITYLATAEGRVYLAVIIDLFSRQVVGWSMQPHMKAELVTDALRMAWFRRRPEAGVIVHSDRGSQYCTGLFQDTLKAYGMRSSMSRRSDCWDNAPTESLWSSLKVARMHGRHFATRRAAMDEVIDWLGFYNARRLHSTLNYVSPMTFEKNWAAVQRGEAALFPWLWDSSNRGKVTVRSLMGTRLAQLLYIYKTTVVRRLTIYLS